MFYSLVIWTQSINNHNPLARVSLGFPRVMDVDSLQQIAMCHVTPHVLERNIYIQSIHHDNDPLKGFKNE